MNSREITLQKLAASLRQSGFETASFLHSNSCFDLAARRPGLTLLLKVFENVDALREEHAIELKKLVRLFNAVVLVVGNKTKAFALKRGVIYERYGLPAVSADSFKDILKERLPNIRAFKGRETVGLDSEKIRKKRRALGLTLDALASKIDSTTESIHRYEKGHSASLLVAEKLEKALNTRLVEKIDLFKENKIDAGDVFDEFIPDSALERVHDLGVNLALFKHAPFRAGSAPSQQVVISKGASKQDIKKKAIELSRTKIAFKAPSMVIASKTSIKAVEHVPVIEEQELTTLSKFNDLMKLLKEREKGNG